MGAVENYLNANTEFEAAKRDLSRLAATLQEFGQNLQHHPERTFFSNVGESGGLPMDIVMSSASKSMDANAWPTPGQIQAAIGRRFAAKQAVQTAWSAVPEAMRTSLVAPKF